MVSPHLDDAALSCAALLERTEPVDVVTVFAGSPEPPMRGRWDEITGFASSGEAMLTRLREDEQAFAGSPHTVTTLPLVELQYVDGERQTSDARSIETVVEQWLSRGAGSVALPVGAGFVPNFFWRRLRHLRSTSPRIPRLARLSHPRTTSGDTFDQHPDHVFVRDAVLRRFGRRHDVSMILYEELPYLWSGPSDARARKAARKVGRKAVEFREKIDRRAKAERIRNYASQTGHLTVPGRRLDDPTVLPPHERYWLLVP